MEDEPEYSTQNYQTILQAPTETPRSIHIHPTVTDIVYTERSTYQDAV